MARRNSESGGRRSARSGDSKKSTGRSYKKDNPKEGRTGKPASRSGRSFGKKEDARGDAFKSSGRGERKFKRTDAPSESNNRTRPAGRSRNSDSSEGKSFDKPYKKSFREGKEEFDGKRKTAEEKKSSASYGLPYKRSYDKKALKKGGPRREENSERPESSRANQPYKKTFRSKRDAADAPPKDPEVIRLNRYIANSGLCSRREADEFITMGLVTVNGEVVSELGHKVKRSDEVRFEGKLLKAEKPVYILMNKPKGYITTTKDPQERNTVMHILGDAVKERVYPVGRLDRNTTGLLLLTNDGELADKLMHPSYMAKKIYRVELNRPLAKGDFEKIQKGVYLEEGRAVVDDIAMLEDNQSVGIEIHIGWNRVVRRIFEALGYEVLKLDRTLYAGLDKKDLGRGEWRYLKQEEIVKLKHYDK